MSDEVFIGVVAPASCDMIVTSPLTAVGVPLFDLATVTAVALTVLKPNVATEFSWSASYAYDGTKKELLVSHPFALGDVDRVGQYLFFVTVTLPEGPLRTRTRSFIAKQKFDTTL